MMILRSSPASPFARKVRIAMSLLGLADKIEIRDTDLNSADDPIRTQNPLGKVPALIIEDGTAYYDSRVILDYLDHLAGGGRILPREPQARFEALRLQALCDGILEASLLIVYEGRYRPPEMKVPSWLDRQVGESHARARRARSRAAADRHAADRRPDRARLRARLPRSALRRRLAQRPPAAASPGTTSSRRRCRPSRRPKSTHKSAAPNKSPGARAPGLCRFQTASFLEVVVHAGAHDIGLEFGIGADHR